MTASPIAQPQGVPLRSAFRTCVWLLRRTGFAWRAFGYWLGGQPFAGLTVRGRPGQVRRPAAAASTAARARRAVLGRRRT
jgi:hypothetical protein